MLGRSLLYISFATVFLLLLLNAIWWFQSTKIVLRLANISELAASTAGRVQQDGTYYFRKFNTSPLLYGVSAYWDQSYKAVRVFMLKQNNSKPRIKCGFGNSEERSTELIPSTDCEGQQYGFTEWNEFRATTRGFSICCALPSSTADITHSTLFLSLDVNTALKVPTVSLPIYRALPVPSQMKTFPFKFAVCIAPMFNMSQFTVTYLVEFLEMHRAMGAELFLIYLSAPPTREVRQVLNSYQTHASLGQPGKFEVIVIEWYLSPSMEPNATWARTQIIAYNDCLYRFSHSAEYFVMTDLDELVVPHPRFGYSWSSMVSGLQAVAGQYFPTACSCLRRMWLEPRNQQSIYYADRIAAVTPDFQCSRKCIVRSGLVRLFHVHEPLLPLWFYSADKMFIVLHYRKCTHNCTPDATEVGMYRYIWALRHRIQPDINQRMSSLMSGKL